MARDFAERVAARRRFRFAFAIAGLLDSVRNGLRERAGGRAAFASLDRRPAYFADLPSDVRHALRRMKRQPGVAAWSIGTLAVALSATVAMMAVVDAALLRPLALPDPSTLVAIRETRDGAGWTLSSYDNVLDWQRATQAMGAMTAMRAQTVNVTGLQRPDRLRGGFVTSSFFDVAGVEPVLGRRLVAADDLEGTAGVVVISDRVWRSRFDADAGTVGRTISLNNTPFTIVGVMPGDFRFPVDDVDAWLPARFHTGSKGRGARTFEAFGRLQAGASVADAQAELDRISAELTQQYPAANRGWQVEVRSLRTRVAGDAQGPLTSVFALMLLLLLAACVNVSSLQIGAGSARRAELSIRAALGAGRARIVRQLVIEHLLIAAAGGLIGIVTAQFILSMIVAGAPLNIFGLAEATVDIRVAAAGFGLTIIAGLVSCLLPVQYWLRVDGPAATGLRGGGRVAGDRSATRVRGVLIATQTAVAAVLLCSGALLVQHHHSTARRDPGFATAHRLTLEYRVPANKYSGEAQSKFHAELVARVARVPGVTRAALVRALPFSGNRDTVSYTPAEASPGDSPMTAEVNTVTDDYFRVMEIPLLRGRTFSDQDVAGAPLVMVVNEAFAETTWPGLDPLGREVAFPGTPMRATIIGIVGNTYHQDLSTAPLPGIFASSLQNPGLFMTLVAETAGDPMAALPDVRRAIWSLDSDQPVWKERTLESLVEQSLRPSRFFSASLVAVAAAAMLLVAGGLYAQVSQVVTQRSKEMSLRMALGASRADVFRLVLRQGVVLTLAGLAIGWPGAALASRFLEQAMRISGPSSSLAYLAVAPILGALAMAACYLPARRAMNLDAASVMNRDV
jgi:predicted permease